MLFKAVMTSITQHPRACLPALPQPSRLEMQSHRHAASSPIIENCTHRVFKQDQEPSNKAANCDALPGDQPINFTMHLTLHRVENARQHDSAFWFRASEPGLAGPYVSNRRSGCTQGGARASVSACGLCEDVQLSDAGELVVANDLG